MVCPDCETKNDPDAHYCSECGSLLLFSGHGKAFSGGTTRAYLIALLLLPVVAIAGGLGYYKFFLPEGVAAVVNGEDIKRSELDAAVALTRAPGTEASEATQDGRGLRYEVLSGLITERLVLQEARKAGISVSPAEVALAASRVQALPAGDKNDFYAIMARRFGGGLPFEEAVRLDLLTQRIVAARAEPRSGESQRIGDAVNAWLQDLSARASVRIALAEQWFGGCGCGDPKAQASTDFGPDDGTHGKLGDVPVSPPHPCSLARTATKRSGIKTRSAVLPASPCRRD